MNFIERELNGMDSVESPQMENVLGVLDDLLKRRTGLVAMKSARESVESGTVSEDARSIIVGALNSVTGINSEGTPYARPRSNSNDTWGFGWSWFNDVAGVDDADVDTYWDQLGTGDLQAIIGAGADAGLWTIQDGMLQVSKEAAKDQGKSSLDLSIALKQTGLEVNTHVSRESGWFEFDDKAIGTNDTIESVTVQNTQRSWAMDQQGNFSPSPTSVDGMGGGAFQDDMSKVFAFREESWSEWFDSKMASVPGNLAANAMSEAMGVPTNKPGPDRADVFEANILAQGIGTGRSADSARKWMDNPVSRQLLGSYGRPARGLFLSESAPVEQEVLAKQMEASRETLSNANIELDVQQIA